MFAVDYLVPTLLAPRKWDWFKRHLFDLAVVQLPMIRPILVLRVLTALNALRRTGGIALRGRIVMYVAASVVMLVLIGALAVMDAPLGNQMIRDTKALAELLRGTPMKAGDDVREAERRFFDTLGKDRGR
ncbi:hypothetical protein CRD60_01115 [Bifidobacterium aemilianum]|uniref:Uncharacterized protein n=1 Tax=Bifidobacterium aemilianum TaxID=2493120 RepID=A0A366K9U3_9BIFI|nr:hypothetical protein CRD60_01115 [Bifidobacterium aemilianum]